MQRFSCTGPGCKALFRSQNLMFANVSSFRTPHCVRNRKDSKRRCRTRLQHKQSVVTRDVAKTIGFTGLLRSLGSYLHQWLVSVTSINAWGMRFRFHPPQKYIFGISNRVTSLKLVRNPRGMMSPSNLADCHSNHQTLNWSK